MKFLRISGQDKLKLPYVLRSNQQEIIETIEKEIGKKAVKIFEPIQSGDVTSTHADVSKLQDWIGYQPTTSVEKGVKKFIEWYKKYYNC